MSEFAGRLNPYVPPVEAPAIRPSLPDRTEKAGAGRRSALRITVRWLLVCSLCALPSFLLGLAVTAGEYAGMVIGVALFVIAYSIADYRTAGSAWRQRPLIRRTLRITYGTRIAISLLLPIGLHLDILFGTVAISITEALTGEAFRGIDPDRGMSFPSALLTTLFQGMLLNAAMAVYATVILAIQALVRAIRR